MTRSVGLQYSPFQLVGGMEICCEFRNVRNLRFIGIEQNLIMVQV